MRMVDRNSNWLVGMVESSWMMVNHVVVMAMHLMMFLVDCMMCAMVSYSMTDMMSWG